jgi:hypothetical protein
METRFPRLIAPTTIKSTKRPPRRRFKRSLVLQLRPVQKTNLSTNARRGATPKAISISTSRLKTTSSTAKTPISERGKLSFLASRERVSLVRKNTALGSALKRRQIEPVDCKIDNEVPAPRSERVCNLGVQTCGLCPQAIQRVRTRDNPGPPQSRHFVPGYYRAICPGHWPCD